MYDSRERPQEMQPGFGAPAHGFCKFPIHSKRPITPGYDSFKHGSYQRRSRVEFSLRRVSMPEG